MQPIADELRHKERADSDSSTPQPLTTPRKNQTLWFLLLGTCTVPAVWTLVQATRSDFREAALNVVVCRAVGAKWRSILRGQL